jgi:DNA-binding Lrp family transcriptional regulator
LPAWDQKGLEAVQKEFVVASQQQCADDLDVEVSLVRSAAARLVKRGLLTTPYARSRALATKHKLGVVSGLV